MLLYETVGPTIPTELIIDSRSAIRDHDRTVSTF